MVATVKMLDRLAMEVSELVETAAGVVVRLRFPTVDTEAEVVSAFAISNVENATSVGDTVATDLLGLLTILVVEFAPSVEAAYVVEDADEEILGVNVDESSEVLGSDDDGKDD